MLVMAIEAITQMSPGREIKAYEIREVELLSALTIPLENDGVEVQFCLKRDLDLSNTTDSRATFCLFRCHDSNFTEVCRGSIKAVLEEQSHGDYTEEEDHQIKRATDIATSVKHSYTVERGSDEIYAELRKNGYQYGPSFQSVERVQRNATGQAVADVSLQRPPTSPNSGTPSAIHPSTLDCILQLILPAVAGGGGDKVATWIPTYISKLWISRTGFETSSGRVKVHASTQSRNSRLSVSAMHAMNQDGSARLLHADGIESTVVSEDQQFQGDELSQLPVKRLCYDLIYKPDLSLLDTEQAMRLLRERAPQEPDPTEFLHKLKLYTLVALSRIADTVSEAEIPLEPPCLQKQRRWIQRTVDSAKQQSPPGIPSHWLEYTESSKFEELRDSLKGAGRLGEISVRFGTNVADILRGRTSALQVLEENNILLDDYQLFSAEAKYLAPLGRYIELLAHKNPGMSILEVGAGTGTFSKYVLNVLTTPTSNGPFCQFSRYDLTDTKPEVLDRAAKEFDYLPKLNFRALDINEDPSEQGYEKHSYDIVIAANVSEQTVLLKSI